MVQFLRKKWEKENGYRLRKELFAFADNKIAVQVRRRVFSRAGASVGLTLSRCPSQFFYEWFESKPDGTKQWYRCYGLEVSAARRVRASPSSHTGIFVGLDVQRRRSHAEETDERERCAHL